MAINLYGYWRSSCTWRVRLVLAYKGLAYRVHPVHLLEGGGQQHQPDHLEKSPLAQVPALEHKGLTLSQSLPIMLYLEDSFASPSVLPAEGAARYQVLEIAEAINAGTQPLQNLEVMQRLSKDFGLSKEQARAFASAYIERGLKGTEKLIRRSRGIYCVGNQFTIADACLIPQLYNARRFELDLDKFPVLLEIETALSKLSILDSAHPDRQPDAVLS